MRRYGAINIKTNSPEETIAFGVQIGKKLRAGDVLAYRGGMGAGKTTFTKGVALGMQCDCHVSSPTFALVHEYPGELPLCHFDMYRITSVEDLYSTGFFDYLGGNCVLAIEWSENIESVITGNYITVEFLQDGTDSRTIIVTGDERFEDISS